MKKSLSQTLLLSALLLTSGMAKSDPSITRYFSSGFLYSKQNIEGEEKLKAYSIPLMVSGYYQQYSGSLETSYSKESGGNFSVGDTTLSLGYDIGDSSGFMLMLKEKLATGDEKKGLSTGKNDTSFQLDYGTSLTHKTSFIASIGYILVGKNDKLSLGQGKNMQQGSNSAKELQDIAYASLGLAYTLPNQNTIGALLDVQENIYKDQPNQSNISLLMSHQLNSKQSVTALYARDNLQTSYLGLTFTSQF